MESNILKDLGFDPGILVLTLVIFVVLLLILVIVLFIRFGSLQKKYQSFMKGRGGKSVEDLLKTRIDEFDNLKENDAILNKRMRYLEKCVVQSYQKCGIIKYDAFKEMGGKLSFAFALLNEENSGFVMNSIHSREGCYTYVKEIIKGESYIMLGEEEEQALEAAIQSGTIELD